jgi:hypothetical protein
VVRRGIQLLADSVRRDRVGDTIARSYRTLPQSVEEDEAAMANAMAMTEVEGW